MQNGSQATWGGRFKDLPAQNMIQMGESVSFDYKLAPYDIACSRAHAQMLAKVGILTTEEQQAIDEGLQALLKTIEAGEFDWNPTLEDVHMNIEQALLKITPAAAKLHTARSRNDQVATDTHLYIKDVSAKLIAKIKACTLAFVDHAAANLEQPAPSYTHLQRAQPITIAHYCLAWVEMLYRDILEFENVNERANVCPLGSGALAGTTLPIDREYTASLLGFVDSNGNPRVTTNSLDAIASRDLITKFAFACSQLANHFSRLAEDWILWASAEFQFIHLPDAYTTGSSLMPQKRNPDALELTRGKASRVQGNLMTLLSLSKAQALTYNRDLQEDKPAAFDSAEQVSMILDTFADLLPKVAFNHAKLKEAALDPILFATDIADYLVEKGVPFRDSHHIVGQLVAEAEKSGMALNEIPLETAQQISTQLAEDFYQVFDFERSISKRIATGMPNPRLNAGLIEQWRQKIS